MTEQQHQEARPGIAAGAGTPGVRRMFSIIDEMVADGRLVYDPDRDIIDVGTGRHRPRPTLLRQPGYRAIKRYWGVADD